MASLVPVKMETADDDEDLPPALELVASPKKRKVESDQGYRPEDITGSTATPVPSAPPVAVFSASSNNNNVVVNPIVDEQKHGPAPNLAGVIADYNARNPGRPVNRQEAEAMNEFPDALQPVGWYQQLGGNERDPLTLIHLHSQLVIQNWENRERAARDRCREEKARMQAQWHTTEEKYKLELEELRQQKRLQDSEHKLAKSRWEAKMDDLQQQKRRQESEHKFQKDQWAADRKAWSEEKKRLQKQEKDCMDEKKALNDRYTELKRRYVYNMNEVVRHYMSPLAQNQLGGLTLFSDHADLLVWDDKWRRLHEGNGDDVKMNTDEPTYPLLRERYDYVRLMLEELKQRFEALRSWKTDFIRKLAELVPPDVTQFSAQDRVAFLARIETYQSYLALLDHNVRDLVRTQTNLLPPGTDDFVVDEAKIPLDKGVAKTQELLQKERRYSEEERKAHADELMRLRTQIQKTDSVLILYRTLIERVNGVWISIKESVPQTERSDIEEMMATSVRNLRDSERGLKSAFRDLEPAIGADAKGIATVGQQLQKLQIQYREMKETLKLTQDELKKLQEAKKDNAKWQSLCSSMSWWGSQMASYLWYMTTGNGLTPELIMGHLRFMQQESQRLTQQELLWNLWTFFTTQQQPNQQASNQAIVKEIFDVLRDESTRYTTATSEWIADFVETAPPAGMRAFEVPEVRPTKGPRSFFQDFSTTQLFQKLREWEQDLTKKVAPMDQDDDGKEEKKELEVKEPLGQESAMPSPVLSQSQAEAEYRARQFAYQAEVERFRQSFLIPSIDGLSYAPGLTEPNSVREARLRVYRLFACHLKWLTWFASHCPSLTDQGPKWHDTALSHLYRTTEQFQNQTGALMREMVETERKRTDTVVTVMRNLADLVRVQFSAYWADRVLLEQTFRPDTSTPLVLLENRRETMVRQAVDQMGAIWRDKNWSVEYPSKPLERYAESAWKELVKEWKEEVKETAQELKEQQKQLEEWAKKAQNAASNLGISQDADAVSDQPKILDLINQCIKDERKELADWDKAVRDLANQWIKFSKDKPALRTQEDEVKYPALVRSDKQESSLPELVYRWFPRFQLLFQLYTEWSSKADQAFALADKNPFVGKAGSDVFVTVDVPAKLEVNMLHLLRRFEIKARTMEQLGQVVLAQANRGGFGARAPITTASLGNGKTKGTTGGTTSVASVTSLSSRPRKELMEVDGERLQKFSFKNTRNSDLIEWKTPSQRVFDFFVLMAGKAAVDLSELVIPQYLEDQNGQSLHVVPIDPLSLVGSVTNGKTEAATVALATLTDTVTQANAELKKKANQTTYAVRRLAREWNTGQKETDPDPDAEPDEKHVTPSSALTLPTLSSAELIDHEYSTVLTTNAYTAISASLAFLRNHHLHRDATLLGLASHRKYRQPFAEYCAAEYKFRQLQNLAIPSRDRSPQDRAVVNQALEAAKFRLLNS